MEGRIRGSFPGGPSRPTPDEEPRRAPHLRSVSELEEGVSRRALKSRHRRRGRRVGAGLAVALVVAFALGLALGRSAHTTAEELTAARRAEQSRDLNVSSEVNRVLLELWRMEDVEALRNSGRGR